MANVKIIKSIIPAGNKSRLPLVKKATKWIVIHETGNRSRGASAKSHAKYLTNVAKANMQYYSWHYTVDSKEIYQHMPDNEVAFHAGDGNAPQGGNYMGIGIEICVNPESNFEVAKDNAAWLTAKLLKEHKLTISAVKQHYDFSSYGKNCPETIRNTGTWGKFISAVEKYLNGGQANTVVSKPATPAPTPVNINTTIKIGSKVSIKSGAVYGGLSIARGRAIPSAYTGNTKQFTVKKLATHKGTQEALLDGISSWVSLYSLSLISSNNPPSVANTGTSKPVANKPKVTANRYKKGSTIQLKNTPLYASAYANKEISKKTGTYYIYSGIVVNKKVAITNAKKSVGKSPAGMYVTGWIKL